MDERRSVNGTHETIVERVKRGIAAATSAILVFETHDLPGVLVVDKAPPEAADAAGTSERLGVIDEAENVEADFDGECREKVDLEPGSDDRGKMRELAHAEQIGELRDELESRRLRILGQDEREVLEQRGRVLRVDDRRM